MMTRHEVLLALGPGGTTELAERVLQLIATHEAHWLVATETVLCRLELGGLSEVCRLLGESRQTVGHWIAGRRWPTGHPTPHFPEPLVTLDATPVWDLATVREWAAEVGLQVVDNPVDNPVTCTNPAELSNGVWHDR